MNAPEQYASHALVCFYDTEDETAVNLAPCEAALILVAVVDESAERLAMVACRSRGGLEVFAVSSVILRYTVLFAWM